jgi:hypothetical protein
MEEMNHPNIHPDRPILFLSKPDEISGIHLRGGSYADDLRSQVPVERESYLC